MLYASGVGVPPRIERCRVPRAVAKIEGVGVVQGVLLARHLALLAALGSLRRRDLLGPWLLHSACHVTWLCVRFLCSGSMLLGMAGLCLLNCRRYRNHRHRATRQMIRPILILSSFNLREHWHAQHTQLQGHHPTRDQSTNLVRCATIVKQQTDLKNRGLRIRKQSRAQSRRRSQGNAEVTFCECQTRSFLAGNTT